MSQMFHHQNLPNNDNWLAMNSFVPTDHLVVFLQSLFCYLFYAGIDRSLGIVDCCFPSCVDGWFFVWIV
jgi:hypothetical protein